MYAKLTKEQLRSALNDSAQARKLAEGIVPQFDNVECIVAPASFEVRQAYFLLVKTLEEDYDNIGTYDNLIFDLYNTRQTFAVRACLADLLAVREDINSLYGQVHAWD